MNEWLCIFGIVYVIVADSDSKSEEGVCDITEAGPFSKSMIYSGL